MRDRVVVINFFRDIIAMSLDAYTIGGSGLQSLVHRINRHDLKNVVPNTVLSILVEWPTYY